MSFTTVLFYLLSLVLVIAAFRVITARSPVVAVLHLILTFFTASMLWMLLQAEFLALLLIIIYVGAVMVMFLFVVMMLDMRSEAVRNSFRTHMPLGIIVGLIMVAEMAVLLVRSWLETPAVEVTQEVNNTLALGIAMYSEYPFAVELGGIVLLVGMVSAIALTLRKRSDARYTIVSEQLKVRAQDRVRLVDMPSQDDAAQTPSTHSQGNA